MEKLYNWSKFNKEIYLKVPINELYEAWTVPSKLEKWFLMEAVFKDDFGDDVNPDLPIQQGYTFKWTWFNNEDYMIGTVLQANGSNNFQFVFGKAGRVNVSLIKSDEGYTVDLCQEQIPTDEKYKAMYHVRCLEIWTFYLANLKSVLEGGLDLRNKKAIVSQLANA